MFSVSSMFRKISTFALSKTSKKSYPLYRLGYNILEPDQRYKEKVICIKDYSNIYYKFVKVEVK